MKLIQKLLIIVVVISISGCGDENTSPVSTPAKDDGRFKIENEIKKINHNDNECPSRFTGKYCVENELGVATSDCENFEFDYNQNNELSFVIKGKGYSRIDGTMMKFDFTDLPNKEIIKTFGYCKDQSFIVVYSDVLNKSENEFEITTVRPNTVGSELNYIQTGNHPNSGKFKRTKIYKKQ